LHCSRRICARRHHRYDGPGRHRGISGGRYGSELRKYFGGYSANHYQLHGGERGGFESFVFDQIAGVQFSVGGMVGTNELAVYTLSGAIAGDAKSGTNVLGPVDFDFTTKFNSSGLIEIYFPTKVSEVGFWLNPSLGNVELIAADTNFAFSHDPETNLEVANSVTAGHFVGIQRPTADIGGFKIMAKGTTGFTIDDFTFGGSSTTSSTPEPGTLCLLGLGFAAVLARLSAKS
jgi:hypothetical protein